MLIDNKWMQAAVAVIALSSVQVFAAEADEEDTYLSKMKALSQDSAALQVEPAAIEADSDVLAGTDLKNLADEMKEEFKPDIGDMKPKL